MLIRHLADRITHNSRHFESAQAQATYYLDLYYQRHHSRFVNTVAFTYPQGFRLAEVLRMRLMLSLYNQLISGEFELTLQNRRDILARILHEYDYHQPRNGLFQGRFDSFRQYLQQSMNAVDQAVRDFNLPPLLIDDQFEERLIVLSEQGNVQLATPLPSFNTEYSARLDILNARCEKLKMPEIDLPDRYSCMSTTFILNDPVQLSAEDKRFIDREALRVMIDKSPRIYVLRNGARIPGIRHPLRVGEFSIDELETIVNRPATEIEITVKQEIGEFLTGKENELNEKDEAIRQAALLVVSEKIAEEGTDEERQLYREIQSKIRDQSREMIDKSIK